MRNRFPNRLLLLGSIALCGMKPSLPSWSDDSCLRFGRRYPFLLIQRHVEQSLWEGERPQAFESRSGRSSGTCWLSSERAGALRSPVGVASLSSSAGTMGCSTTGQPERPRRTDHEAFGVPNALATWDIAVNDSTTMRAFAVPVVGETT